MKTKMKVQELLTLIKEDQNRLDALNMFLRDNERVFDPWGLALLETTRDMYFKRIKGWKNVEVLPNEKGDIIHE